MGENIEAGTKAVATPRNADEELKPEPVPTPVATAKPSGDLILITKQVRMEWTDVMALDADLSPTAFKVASWTHAIGLRTTAKPSACARRPRCSIVMQGAIHRDSNWPQLTLSAPTGATRSPDY